MTRLCSACLLGVPCRYNGASKPNEKILVLAKNEMLIPVCPEQLGGLSTPRKPAERCGKCVVARDGEDVTEQFMRGAQEVLKIAKLYDIKSAIFKQCSPSCGCGQIYDGSFTGRIIKGDGITTQLLKENGTEVLSDEDV
ncbi:MAG: DUF523 domain-containing protein [Parcubacteria group bacterium]|jgi:uncharacterized protein YbbK (DUF523 family)